MVAMSRRKIDPALGEMSRAAPGPEPRPSAVFTLKPSRQCMQSFRGSGR